MEKAVAGTPRNDLLSAREMLQLGALAVLSEDLETKSCDSYTHTYIKEINIKRSLYIYIYKYIQ